MAENTSITESMPKAVSASDPGSPGPGAAALDPRPERGGRWSRMSDLAMLQCVPCKGGTSPLRGPELDDLWARLGNDWRVVEQHHLEKEFRFKNFREALDFTNRVGDLAEEQGHHPDIYLAWGKVRLTVWTHKIDGLTESDFVFAAKSDRAL
jgi:4a-hydroxytetrahydrobiopterin dehydratase